MNERIQRWFHINAKPVPLLRPRISDNRMYSPKKVTDHKELIKRDYRITHKNAPVLTGALKIEITFYIPKPKSAKKRKFPAVKPDLDNYVKLVLDALNGLCYVDDGQVVEIHASKNYGDLTCTLVKVTELMTYNECFNKKDSSNGK